MIEINCLNYILVKDLLYDHLTMRNEYKVRNIDSSNYYLDLFIDNKDVRLYMTTDLSKPKIDVCFVCRTIAFSDFNNRVKISSSACEKSCPNAPIIIACYDPEKRYKPSLIKKAELGGWKITNQKMGNKLASEIGAVKFLQWSNETGKGLKIVIDEIVFAGIGKLRDENEQ